MDAHNLRYIKDQTFIFIFIKLLIINNNALYNYFAQFNVTRVYFKNLKALKSFTD